MFRIPLVIISGFVLGIIVGIGVVFYTPLLHLKSAHLQNPVKREVLGFLPYSLLYRAKKDYSPFINTLAYFSLQIDTDGSIVKMANATQEDPGWNHLQDGDASPFLDSAKAHNQKLSLVVYSGNNDTINQLVSAPVMHAHNLTTEVIPIMKEYGFSDLNLDIESTQLASQSAQKSFTAFVYTVKNDLSTDHVGTLSLDVSTYALIANNLISPKAVGAIADKIIIMGYDYHSTASLVTGPIAPVGGAGTESEYDISSALQKALTVMPAEKILLGSPLYGYEWETLLPIPRAAVIPGSGTVASSRRTGELLKTCTNCKVTMDPVAEEPYTIYFDNQTDTYHQIFYPNQTSMQSKVTLADRENLGGLALWAMGFEDNSILNPLKKYLAQ